MESLTKKVTDSEPWSVCQKGDILRIERHGGWYSHFAVYVGNGRVIHYAAENGDFLGGKISIHEASFNDFLGDDTSFDILNFPDEYGKPDSRTVNLAAGVLVWNPNTIYKLLKKIQKNYDINEYKLYSPEETVKRARSKLGETEYSLVFNNCEHFAIWCKTGISESRQVDAVMDSLSCATHIAIA